MHLFTKQPKNVEKTQNNPKIVDGLRVLVYFRRSHNQRIEQVLSALTKLQGQLVKDFREKGSNLANINEQFGKALAAFSQRTATEESTGVYQRFPVHMIGFSMALSKFSDIYMDMAHLERLYVCGVKRRANFLRWMSVSLFLLK
jgi:hypothetical protein